MKKSSNFEKAFTRLGSMLELPESSDHHKFEEFVCKLYGFIETNINVVRHKMFTKKHTMQKKIVNLSSLPPCRQVLRLHTLRANSVAAIWKSSSQPMVDLHEMIGVGWKSD